MGFAETVSSLTSLRFDSTGHPLTLWPSAYNTNSKAVGPTVACKPKRRTDLASLTPVGHDRLLDLGREELRPQADRPFDRYVLHPDELDYQCLS